MAEANCRVKRCPGCSTEKPTSEFNNDRSKADGLCSACRDCKRQQLARRKATRGDELRKRDRDYKRGNPEVNRRRREARQANLESARRYQREYLRANPDKREAYRKSQSERQGAEQVLAYHRAWRRKQRETNPAYRLACSARCRISQFMRYRGFTKSLRTLEMIGCAWPAFAQHIEAKFAPGMTFENYGEWHLDRIVPLASATNDADVIRLCHYSNLQPLWAADNRRKSASLPGGA